MGGRRFGEGGQFPPAKNTPNMSLGYVQTHVQAYMSMDVAYDSVISDFVFFTEFWPPINAPLEKCYAPGAFKGINTVCLLHYYIV